jgi:hypothetical protein
MDAKSMFRVSVLTAGMLAGWSGGALAAPPWDKMLSASRVDADPQKPYTLAEDNGPWMIMANSFSGDGAQQQAHDLVIELRKKYKLPAYVYERKIELGETFGRGVNQFGEPMKMKYKRGSEIREIAVMVGNFPTIDDPSAQETLRKIKTARPETLELKEGKKTNANLADWRWLTPRLPGNEAKKALGPMGHAFITTNPLLPKEYFAPKGVDHFVVRLNDGLEFSLLNCPGKYSIRVAHFTGAAEIKPEKVKDIKEGRAQLKSQLGEAAENAHRVATTLRSKGYEAYEFHDRTSSMVTVGHFETVGTPRPDGCFEFDPKIAKIIRVFGANSDGTAGQQAGVKPQYLEGIPFDIQPIPVEVPKRSFASDYHRDVAGRQSLFQSGQ